MLLERYALESLNVCAQADWTPYPTASQRTPWESLPAEARQAMLDAGEAALQQEWQPLLASDFLKFATTGSRLAYETPYFRRRHLVNTLALAECIEGKGRFLEHLVDGLWLICEESYWGIPAHLYAQRASIGLPDVTEPTVDLFVAETAMDLAYIDYLLADQLESISPLICPRIAAEIQHKLLIPNLERDDFWWMGNIPERYLNNWTPWICSNWLACILFIEPDPALRRQMVHKAMHSLDAYLTGQPDDGGCDEGPNYWGRAGASVYDCLELLDQATGGQVKLFDQPKIQEMGRFIYRTQIEDNYYVNFADASAIVKPDAALIYRYGQAIDDATMTTFGAWVFQKLLADQYDTSIPIIDGPMRKLRSLFATGEIMQVQAAPPQPRDVWLPDVQVMIARDQAGSAEGFYVAAKGGHNNESHNHNDIGEFIVYMDGLPILIDAGVEDYSRKTFSPQRYEIWAMQSAYHNLPTIDGVQQAPGQEFAARSVQYDVDDSGAEFSLDIAAAYPPEAGLKQWQRVVRLQRGQQVEIEDQYTFDRAPGTLTLSLLTACAAAVTRPGEIALTPADLIDGRKSGTAHLTYDADLFTPSVEGVAITDHRMHGCWGDEVRRIVLTVNQPQSQGKWQLQIKR